MMLQSKIDEIKAMYADGLKGDIEITEREYKDKLAKSKNDLNIEMNEEIKELILSRDNAMRMEIRELKAAEESA